MTITRARNGQDGFSLLELLVVLAISSIALTVGTMTIRHYWLVRSLEGGTDEVVSQLRRQQERSVSESLPLIYGARFREGSANWGLILFNPNGDNPDTCTQTSERRFGSGVIVNSDSSATSFSSGSADGVDITSFCRSQSGWTVDEFVFFYPRGSATTGTLKLTHPLLGRDRMITVTGLTGRVERS